MKVKLKLFFEWGIKFDENNPYTVPENSNRIVRYASKDELLERIIEKYHVSSHKGVRHTESRLKLTKSEVGDIVKT